MASEKTVNRTVAGVVLAVLLFAFSMIAREVVIDIFIWGPSTLRGGLFSLALFASVVVVYLATRVLVWDIISGEGPKPSK